jgi:tRNA pseudouridine55 synthase
VILVDKPAGVTSHDVVSRLRRALSERRVGHAGTLDPMATGLLVGLVGEATKLEPYVATASKTYVATIRFGRSTDTLDADGVTTAIAEPPAWLLAELAAIATGDDARAPKVAAALATLRGRTEQVPPAHSAIHVDGRRAYDLARKGVAVTLAPRSVRILCCDTLGASLGLAAPGPHALASSPPGGGESSTHSPRPSERDPRSGPLRPSPGAANSPPSGGESSTHSPRPTRNARAAVRSIRLPGAANYEGGPTLQVRLHAEKGFYVRSFARDLCELLKVPGHLSGLRRTASGRFSLADAVPLESVASAPLLSLEVALERAGVPQLALSEADADHVRHGRALPPRAELAGTVALLSPSGKLLALAEAAERAIRVVRGFTGSEAG